MPAAIAGKWVSQALLLQLPQLPQRHQLWSSPQPTIRYLCYFLQPLKGHIVWSIPAITLSEACSAGWMLSSGSCGIFISLARYWTMSYGWTQIRGEQDTTRTLQTAKPSAADSNSMA